MKDTRSRPIPTTAELGWLIEQSARTLRWLALWRLSIDRCARFGLFAPPGPVDEVAYACAEAWRARVKDGMQRYGRLK